MTRRIVALLVCWWCTNAWAETRVSGYLKNFSIIQDSVSSDLADLNHSYRSQFTGRLMFEGIGEKLSWQIHYELGAEFSSLKQPGFNLPVEKNSYRLTDIKGQLSDDNSKSLVVENLDRFNVQLPFEFGDLTIGRQPITFGSARIINPTDVFLPFNVQALNTEYRIGIDAIRFQKPIGQLSEIDIGYVLGEDSDQSAIFSRLKTNAFGSDFEFTAIRFSEQRLFGVGVESTLGPFGSWLEFAHVGGDDTYNRTSLGLDYGFNESVFGMLEYHYNGAGDRESENYFGLFAQPAYVAGGVFLLGENYLIPSLSWQASALSSYGLQLLVNLDDRSSFTILSFDRSLSDNLYLGVSVYWFQGDEAEVTIAGADLGSEYGNNPNQLIINLRYYF